MKKLHLVLPSPEYKKQILEYKAEFIKSNDSIDGSAGLQSADTFEEWYKSACDNSKEETVRPGLVPGTSFLGVCTDDNKLIGMVNVRHRLNDGLLISGGHIGYSVRKSERQKGYATQMLALALLECKKIGLTKVLVTCNKTNIGSAKAIINNNGVLENEVLNKESNIISQRYWINLEGNLGDSSED